VFSFYCRISCFKNQYNIVKVRKERMEQEQQVENAEIAEIGMKKKLSLSL
jgi:hypothetical protein